MKILIIRHGDPDYSIDSLTEKGWREAALLSERLEKMDIDDFYVSPLGRARDTARDTLRRVGKTAEVLPWLEEFRGRTCSPHTAEFKLPWNLTPQYWTLQPELYSKDEWRENGLFRTGNVEEIYDETADGVDELLARYGYIRDGAIYRCEQNSDKTIALVCHFALGMVILSHILGVSPVVMWQCFFMPTSSVTTLVTEERRPGEVFFKCMQVGDTSHLYAGGEPVSRSGLFQEIYGQDGVKAAQ